MSREELKRLFLTFPTLDISEKKQIIVNMDKYEGRLGQGTVEILSDGPGGYSSFKTYQEYPYTYVTSRKEFASGEYELIIKE